MNPKYYRAAGGVVVQQALLPDLDPTQAYVLLLDRPARAEIRLPKGHVDDEDEDDAAAALRETSEESGYADLAILADLGEEVVEYDYKDRHVVRHEHYFLMRLQSLRQIQRSEVDAEQFLPLWVPLSQAESQLTYIAEQEWMARAIDHLRKIK